MLLTRNQRLKNDDGGSEGVLVTEEIFGGQLYHAKKTVPTSEEIMLMIRTFDKNVCLQVIVNDLRLKNSRWTFHN